MPKRRDEQTIGRIAALADPVRRALYFFVSRAPGEVSRDQAARGVAIARPLAAFHLDKLAAHGLLEVSFRRLTARRGPGAGRPAKLYRRARHQIDVSLPPRRYELAARLLAATLGTGDTASPRARLRRVARALGKRLGSEARRGAGLPAVTNALTECGYEPFRAADGSIRLHNCPFDTLARDYRPLMCSANQALLAGLVQGFGLPRCEARLDPRPGLCCVALRPAR
jgi:predicted ArsR family transcriptional regulator